MNYLKKSLSNEKGMEFITVFVLAGISVVVGGLVWSGTSDTLMAIVTQMGKELTSMYQ